MRAFPVACILVILASASAANAAQTLLAGDASAITMEGNASLLGELIVIEGGRQSEDAGLPTVNDAAGAMTPPTRIRITGQEIVVSTDVHTNRATGPLANPATEVPSSERHVYGPETTLVADEFRLNPYVFVVPTRSGSAALELTADDITLQPSEPPVTASAQWYKQVENAPLAVPSTAGSASATPSGWRALRVEGDFALTAWDIVFTADGAHRGDDLRSGYFFSPVGGMDAPVDVAGDAEARQIYLHVTDGTLEFFFDADPTLTVFLQPHSGGAGRGISLLDAAGVVTLPNGQEDLGGRDISLDGSFDLAFNAASNGRLPTTATGEATRAIVGGKSYVYPETATTASTATFAGWGLAAIGVVALGAAVFLRRRAQVRSLERVERFMDEGAYARAIAAATPSLVRSRRHGSDVQVMRTVSLLCLGRHDEAKAALESWHGLQGATVDYLWAFLHAAKGEVADAKQRVATCLAKEPGMQTEIDSNPVLAAVLPSRPAARPSVASREGYT